MTTQALSPSPMVSRGLVTPGILRAALIESFVKLLPQQQWKNPVMFVVYIGSILTTILWIQALTGQGEAPAGFILAVTSTRPPRTVPSKRLECPMKSKTNGLAGLR